MSKAQAARGALAALVDAYKRTFDPETYYHTTPMGKLEGDKFDPNFSFVDDGGLGATYFTKDKSYANEAADFWRDQDPELDYAEITTYPVKIKTKDLFDYKNQKHIEKLSTEINLSPEQFLGITRGDPYFFEFDDIQDSLKKLGFRGYHIDEPGSVALFNPDKGDVRSIHAKFDPEKSESGNILASVPAAALFTLGGAGALSNLADE
jgi:hypothetical protein